MANLGQSNEDHESETKNSILKIIKGNPSLIMPIILTIGLILIRIFFITPENYNLIHLPLEFFSIFIAWTIFLIAWNSRRFAANSFFLFLGISFLFIGALDLVHTLAYRGLFVDFSNWAAQLWIAARYVHAISFLAAIFFIKRTVKIRATFFIYAMSSIVLLLTIFGGIFPVCYNDALGALTLFKKISEYVIISILIVSSILFAKERKQFESSVFRMIILAIIFTIFSEYSFTLYIDVTGMANLIGHIFKIFSFYCIYKGLIQMSLEKPYSTLFRSLKMSEDRLLLQKKELDQILKISVPMCLIDKNFNVELVNDTFCSYFRISREKALSQKCYEIRKGPFCHTKKCSINQLSAGIENYEYEAELEIDENTSIVYIISAHPFLGSSGELLGIVENFTDITDRKAAEEELRKSEEKFRTLFNSASDAICIHDPEGTFIEVNQMTCERLGYNRDELLKMSPMDINSPKFLKFLQEQNKELFKRGQIIFNTEHVRSDGKAIQVEVNSILITYGGKKAILSIARDITERIEFENLRKQIIYTVSHELRTPISIISQAISNLQKYKIQLSEDQRDKVIDSVSRNAGLLTELIEDLLLVSRIDSEKIQLNQVEYNLSEVLQDVLNQLKPRQKTKKIRIQCDVGQDIQLFGDTLRIGQIFRIFIDNAIKYSDENSKIGIIAADHYKGRYNPDAVDGVLIQFIDEGRGIRDQEISNIFERFFRSEDVVGIPGTGLGLSIAQNLAQLHQGNVYVESTYRKGSNFILFLPRRKAPI